MGSKLQRNIEYSVFNRGILNTFESTCEEKINKYLLSGKFVVNFLNFSPPPSLTSCFRSCLNLQKMSRGRPPQGDFFLVTSLLQQTLQFAAFLISIENFSDL